MRIIISPAKKMNIDTDSMDIMGFPKFLDKAEQLKLALQNMSKRELQVLWKCNDAIAEKSFQLLWEINLRGNLTPAILSYEGIQYQHMAPGVFTDSQFDYLNEHLRILSGFYGLLRPFDGVAPYRLEMQAKLSVDGYRDLYDFWGEKLARQISCESNIILNLASYEYSKVISSNLPGGVRFLTCTFGELKEGRIIQKGTLCKMARGQMVRWLAENAIICLEDIRHFSESGYRFHAELSTEGNMVFAKVTN